MEFYNRNFLSLLDYSKEEIEYLIDLAIKLKKLKQSDTSHDFLKRKNIAIVFEKESHITRCAFEVAIHDLGMNVTYLKLDNKNETKETITNNHLILEKLYDGIAYYGINHKTAENLAKESRIPVWNGSTDRHNPLQVLASLMTIKEYFKTFKNQRLVYCGDGRSNIASSLMIACSKLGMDFICCSPKEMWPKIELVKKCQKYAEENNSRLFFDEDIMRSTHNATIIYTTPWISNEESKIIREERIKMLYPYQINKRIIKNADQNVIFLHSLPSFHNKDTIIGKEIYEKYGLEELEVTNEVFNSRASKVLKDAENRMHAVKAVMCATLYEGGNK